MDTIVQSFGQSMPVFASRLLHSCHDEIILLICLEKNNFVDFRELMENRTLLGLLVKENFPFVKVYKQAFEI